MKGQNTEDYFADWNQREALAESMIPLVGGLYRDNHVSLFIYGRSMVHLSVIELMKAHRFVRIIEKNELSEYDTFPMVKAIAEMDIRSARIDVGKLTVRRQLESPSTPHREFVERVLGSSLSMQTAPAQPQDVVLYGFGRIGRLVARLLIETSGGGQSLRLRAIVVRGGTSADDLAKRATLLRRDSVHGSFKGTIRVLQESNQLICNGNPIQLIYADSPDNVDYRAHGIENAIVVDNTGVWRDEDALSQHLAQPQIAKVLLTAPGQGNVPNVVFGINDDVIDQKMKIVSAASCTTNAIVPVLKALLDEYGIIKGHVETAHAYTNDQNLIDNYHKKTRRGRGAPLNLVLTETGAAKAVAKAIPELSGKLTGNAIRVPTPNVSLAILNLQLERETTVDQLNEFLRQVALRSRLQQQIGYTVSAEVVSSDFVGERHTCVVDSTSTIVSGNSCVLYCWYDNEFGYCCQVFRCLEKMAGVHLPVLPVEEIEAG